MFLKFVLIGIIFTFIIFFIDTIWPKIKLKYKLHKELKEKEKRKKTFRDKMKELEIK